MTANRTQVGALAVGLLVILVAIGCSSDSDLISSGNVVVTFALGAENPSTIDYSCIRQDFLTVKIRPADGVCSESSGPEFAGRPCGIDLDCTNSTASCDDSFSACDGGINDGLPCVNDNDCPDGSCGVRGECASFPGGIFTGRGCLTDLDCEIVSFEKCAGRCSAGSSSPDVACVETGDCTLGECEGAQAADTVGGNEIILINQNTPGFHTPTCPACELNPLSDPVFCDPDGPNPCTNECLPADQLDVDCATDSCCERFDLVAPPCEDDDDCEENACTDVAIATGSAYIPEGKYNITELKIADLRMFAPDHDPQRRTCAGNNVQAALQYDPPLNFEVGPGMTNEIRFVIDITELENRLGTVGPENCSAAYGDVPEWYHLVAN